MKFTTNYKGYKISRYDGDFRYTIKLRGNELSFKATGLEQACQIIDELIARQKSK